MKVGDLVKQYLTEQVGIVLDTKPETQYMFGSIYVLWTTRGQSLVGPGNKEWCDERGLDLLNENR